MANFYDDLNADKKFSSETCAPSTFNASNSTLTTNQNIPYSQQEALAFSYAQYALMQTLSQQFRANYHPAALLHAAAAYLPLAASSHLINGNSLLTNSNSSKSDDNNNHIGINPATNIDQPYQRETYQNLLESSQILKQSNAQKSAAIDLRKRSNDPSRNDNDECWLYFSFFFNNVK